MPARPRAISGSAARALVRKPLAADVSAGLPAAGQAVPDAKAGRIRQAQESTILQAAEKVFARAGFAGASMSELALAAGLPKSTLHYYFGTKEALHRAVLANILELWLVGMDAIAPDAEPRDALCRYIRHKMVLTAERPDASRVFANELLHGAPQIGDILRNELRPLMRRKAKVVEGWIEAGRMAPVDPVHLFFSLWAMTQTYADFEPQISAVLGAETLGPRAMSRAATHVENFVLRACGLDVASEHN
ncbi:TetR/AcrR family transcriptional regulator [Uliginosibacterium sp. H3]|uniref:TetR/AcrR family transcriptional regulator n=1 Tax=Uliginosibacterium silvisoli TaxID=3114758 RepID=A0ABU6K217_9RHOO|nr:TetR/AcrR family transcriptional regulator [Uliginosibacterium sp. H3]